MSYYRGTEAVVVTPKGYTRAARQLAGSIGVRLLTHNDLTKM